MSKLFYTLFTKLIINHFLSTNKSIPSISSSKLHSSQDDQTITKLSNTVKGDYKFGMEIPDTMISDAIKKLIGYKFYMAKKVESKNAKNFDEPKEQHVSPVKSGRGKGIMCYGDHVVNVPNKLKKDVVPRETRSLTIVKETVVGSGYQQKDRKPSQNDKTEHGMEKTVQNQGQSPKMSKSESILKNQQSNRSRN
ncbi:hypothetical protein Tco_1126337 [Tanacetum coccineum]